jgi:hypothetical protein
MSKKTIGWILIVAGALLTVASLGADLFGIGSSAGFGPNQTLGTVAGLLLAAGGVWLVVKNK